MLIRRLFAVLCAALLLAAGYASAEVQIKEIEAGEGDRAQMHHTLHVHYTGWLEDGTRFDSSHDRGEPLRLVLGQGQVIPGWEMGLEGMKEGGKRELVIPPHLAYGSRGAGGVIPPDATLRFEVELVRMEGPAYSNVSNAELEALLESGVTLIDIRRPDEWQQTGVVEGSVLLTAFDEQGRFNPEFPGEVDRLVDRDEPFVIICRVGNRTAFLSQAMAEQGGYERVHNVTEGIMGWIESGKSVTRSCPDLTFGARC
ncbi:FKBP-type peptidyl-prolyl cis-trans isomerase [Ectothiorhodospira sp. BSL-9]|uniref:FKBP-type peptidyl-prolyl cis-trans isomerase n=1 Tax=Ectothiorhodospira sp. BSL-9 TaxID=1442136 RepID=UPI0007B447F3|nr:FKBP-type peptidyl-prolyl cis-trans isomerase [Ectothiorhodospira sp. BSL-9]ANB03244.1 peptidylprolyl isomerase [Ectothiorhodospira sp. BSL-9]